MSPESGGPPKSASKRLSEQELAELRRRSRRDGGEAAGSAPLSRSAPPDDARPLAGLPLPRGLFAEDLTALEIADISAAWLTGYRERMDDRAAAGEVAPGEPVLWWSPAVAGGWPAGWRWHDHAGGHAAGEETASNSARDGALRGAEGLDHEGSDEAVREAAAGGGAPSRDGLDWRAARVLRRPGSGGTE